MGILTTVGGFAIILIGMISYYRATQIIIHERVFTRINHQGVNLLFISVIIPIALTGAVIIIWLTNSSHDLQITTAQIAVVVCLLSQTIVTPFVWGHCSTEWECASSIYQISQYPIMEDHIIRRIRKLKSNNSGWLIDRYTAGQILTSIERKVKEGRYTVLDLTAYRKPRGFC